MKIILRTVIILVAALVVVEIASALNSAGAFSNLGPLGRGGFEGGREFGREFNGQPPTLPDGTRPNFDQGGFGRGGFERGGREGRNGEISIFGLAEIIKNLGIMAVITVVIVLASNSLKRVRASKQPASPPSTPAA